MIKIFKISFLALAIGFFSNIGVAEEISPGVSILPVTINAPINEQPYFGFAQKTKPQKTADAEFIAHITIKLGMSRELGARQAAAAGWRSIMQGGDWAIAAKRFNQAWLLDPARSEIAHGFAIIVFERFRNADYAFALLKAASQLKEPLPTLPADHARILLIAGRPRDAIPFLQEAIRRTPAWEVPYSNLANAYLDTGDMKLACEALTKIPANDNPRLKTDNDRVRQLAKCP